MSAPNVAVSCAQLTWDEDGQPLSSVYGDVYFSKVSGLDETEHVFLNNNQLPERFAALAEGETFVIGETGFGTGLNFLCAWALFQRTAPANARLHFISTEKHPLTPADLHTALALWPSLKTYAQHLEAQYVAVHMGTQTLVLDDRITLTLLVGDVLQTLPRLTAQVDAWFLDGFAPAKNPEMWQPELFQQLARLSKPNATLATFTSAGFVRRGLIEAGFAMQRVPGFGRKREMLSGTRLKPLPEEAPAPWHAYPTKAKQRRALIIGSGLAGTSSAQALARRGWQVRVIDRHAAPAQAASGNPQGVLYLKLSAHHTPLSQWVISGFGFTRRQLPLLAADDWQACGVLQLARNAAEAKKQQALAEAFPAELLQCVTAEQASALAGVAVEQAGLWFPETGWVHPPALCRAALQYPNIDWLGDTEITALKRDGEQWQLWTGDTLVDQAEVVILANAHEVTRLLPDQPLPIKPIRGQISRLQAQTVTPKTVLCGDGYLAPPRQGELTLGASFNLHDLNLEPYESEQQANLALLDQLCPSLALTYRDAALPYHCDRVAYRCTSTDYLPLVGPLVDPERFASVYAPLSKDSRWRSQAPCPWLTGLYLNTAHGSRGLITAPLSGELLAAWIEHEALPLPSDLAYATLPVRYALRRLIRREQ